MIPYRFIALYFSFLITLPVQNIWAGNEVGNGGDLVLCENSAKLLDYYEADEFGYHIITREGSNHLEIIAEFIKDYKKIDPQLASYFERKLVTYSSDFIFKSKVELTNIKDSKQTTLPKKCSLQQIAIKRKNSNIDKNFIVSQDLWVQLSPTDKAGLIIHEYLYYYFSELGQKDSRKIRQLNAWLMAQKEWNTETKKEYQKLIQNLELPHYP